MENMCVGVASDGDTWGQQPETDKTGSCCYSRLLGQRERGRSQRRTGTLVPDFLVGVRALGVVLLGKRKKRLVFLLPIIPGSLPVRGPLAMVVCKNRAKY